MDMAYEFSSILFNIIALSCSLFCMFLLLMVILVTLIKAGCPNKNTVVFFFKQPTQNIVLTIIIPLLFAWALVHF